jgi:3-deoxy-manno-octulosonate cytidylyltransferase (CMP-KDO synthetase)
VSFTVIIPARYASSRLPGKPLADIGGKPLIQHVYQRAKQCSARQVIIATDDQRIQKVATEFGAEVCMTADSHRSGTERLNEVVDTYQFAADEIIVNVQGDEPLLAYQNIDQVANMLLEQKKIPVATLCSRITTAEDVFDPNIVKVIKDKNDVAIYFSRAPIPWDRNTFATVFDSAGASKIDISLTNIDYPYLKHIGIYAYRAAFIAEYLAYSHTSLETTEALEQLRILENGNNILVKEAGFDPGIGVDTEKDLEKVRTIIKANQ